LGSSFFEQVKISTIVAVLLPMLLLRFVEVNAMLLKSLMPKVGPLLRYKKLSKGG
jgi:hypothetical protein